MATITYTVTVANSGSGNVYYIDGVANPALTFARGNTYVFDLSDSSNSGHPLAFKDSAGNSYTTGVTTTGTAGSTGANVSIVINANTPSRLRYYCTVHGNSMGNTISVAAADAYNALYGDGQYGKAAYGVVFADKTLDGVSATGTISPVQINGFEIDISERVNSVSATGAIGTVSPNNTLPVTGVAGTTSLGTVGVGASGNILSAAGTGLAGSVQVNISEVLTGVSATFTLNAAGLDIRSINRVPVTGLPMTGSIGAIGGGVDEPIAAGVSATGQSGTIQANTAAGVTGVQGTSSIGSVTATGTANTTLTGVEGVGQVNEVEEQVQETITVGVQATSAIGTLALSNTFSITGVQGTFNIGNVTATGVTFTFVAADYDRRRVAYVPRNDTAAERRVAA